MGYLFGYLVLAGQYCKVIHILIVILIIMKKMWITFTVWIFPITSVILYVYTAYERWQYG